MTNNLAPAVRFPGSTDDWEQRKLGEVGELNRGKSKHRPRNDAKLFGGSYPFIQTGDVAKAGLYLTNYGQTYSDFGIQQSKLWNEGTLLITIAANIAETSILGIKAAFPDSVIAFESDDVDMIFVKNVIDKISDMLKRTAETSSQANLNLAKLSELKIDLPSIGEQIKIGAFFKQLDDTIALHQRQLNNYKQQKKYMLQKMFPKDGEKVPEVRFDGFTEEWEQCNLGDVAMIKTGYPFNSEDFDGSGKYLVITNGNIQNDLAFVDNSLGNRIDVSDTVLLNNYELNIGDVLVTMDGTVGRTAKVICSNQIIAQRVGRLIAKDNSEFLYQSLNTGDFSKEMKKVSHGGTIKHISLTEISDYAMFVPATVEEQTKIGAFFKHLDDATDHHQQKVNGYQQLKNAMLQQMFV